jgi:hypothetical protein
VIPIIGATLATIGLCRLVLWSWTISNWVDLGMAAVTVFILFMAVTYSLLASEERMALTDTIVRWRK